ncbi:MAG: hypothetical protein LBK54_10085 [Propionibacteriaceae bacterium]|nr:hypothetical protein [Propionibacteriaceae bacterium]
MVETHRVLSERVRPGAAGRIMQSKSATVDADLVVVVPEPDDLRPGWLTAAAEMIADGAAAVVLGQPDGPLVGTPCPVGAATVFDGGALREVRGFFGRLEPDLMAPDALWRLTLRGGRVECLSGHLCHDRPLPRLTRSQLLTLAASNLELKTLQAVLAPLSLALVSQPLRATGTDTSALDLKRSPGGDDSATLAVPEAALNGAGAIDAWLNQLEAVNWTRPMAQCTRRLSDRCLAQPIAQLIDQLWLDLDSEADSSGVGQRQRLEEAFFGGFSPRPRLRLLAVVDPSRSAPAAKMEAWSAALSPDFDFRALDIANGTLRQRDGTAWTEVPLKPRQLPDWPDLVALDAVLVRSVAWLADSEAPVWIDATDWPFQADLAGEYPGVGRSDPRGIAVQLLSETLDRADHLVAGNVEQRDWLLGALAGRDRVTPVVYDEDHSLNNLVEVAPDSAQALWRWCQRPLRAPDLVQTYPQAGAVAPSPSRRLRLAARLKGRP